MFMSTDLIFGRDVQGLNAYAPPFSTNIYTSVMTTGLAASVTVPSSAPIWIMYIRVEPNGWAWCSRTTTAAVPAGATLAASQSELVVGTIEFKRTVYAGDVISLISPNATCNVQVEFYVAIP